MRDSVKIADYSIYVLCAQWLSIKMVIKKAQKCRWAFGQYWISGIILILYSLVMRNSVKIADYSTYVLCAQLLSITMVIKKAQKADGPLDNIGFLGSFSSFIL